MEHHDCLEITYILCVCMCFQLTCMHSSVKFKSWVATMLSRPIGCGNLFMMTWEDIKVVQVPPHAREDITRGKILYIRIIEAKTGH
jgi:hypothetical protein